MTVHSFDLPAGDYFIGDPGVALQSVTGDGDYGDWDKWLEAADTGEVVLSADWRGNPAFGFPTGADGVFTLVRPGAVPVGLPTDTGLIGVVGYSGLPGDVLDHMVIPSGVFPARMGEGFRVVFDDVSGVLTIGDWVVNLPDEEGSVAESGTDVAPVSPSRAVVLDLAGVDHDIPAGEVTPGDLGEPDFSEEDYVTHWWDQDMYADDTEFGDDDDAEGDESDEQ